MIARWCISVFVFLLTLFGVVSQQQFVVPNQEIVLQFTDVELTSNEAKQTILIVKEQLEALGVENIQVRTHENGQFKISYYCEKDIASIQKSFSQEHKLTIDYQTNNPGKASSKLPLDENSTSYNINVYEIHSGTDAGWDFDGTFTLEVEVKSDRFLDPNSSFSAFNPDHNTSNNIAKLAFKVRRTISIEISEALHSIPEVRAGPFC